jgi:hypothetical protein
MNVLRIIREAGPDDDVLAVLNGRGGNVAGGRWVDIEKVWER